MTSWISPSRLALLAALAVGVMAGIGGYTFVYAKGASYMTNDPAACANCHVMDEHYAAWQRSSHRAVAVCNDCHAPHDLIGKYVVKAENGWRHSVAFTTGRHPDPMRITPRNARVTEQACRDCHAVARDRQRQAQFLVDFVQADNSMGFHAPQEAMRVLALAIEHVREGQKSLRPLLRR